MDTKDMDRADVLEDLRATLLAEVGKVVIGQDDVSRRCWSRSSGRGTRSSVRVRDAIEEPGSEVLVSLAVRPRELVAVPVETAVLRCTP